MKIREAYDEFILEKMVENKSKRTIKSYDVKIGFFLKYVGEKDIEELQVIDVRRYTVELQTKKKVTGETLSSGAVQTYMRHLRAFLNYCYQKKFSSIDWLREVKLPKADKKVIKILTDDEIILTMATLQKEESDFFRTRDIAIVSLMLDTGMRCEEIEFLRCEDIDDVNNFIKVRGKGNKERLVNLSPVIKRNIKRWLRFRKVNNNAVRSLFVNRFGKPISYDVIKKIFLNLKNNTQITRIHPHLCRHTFATRKLLVDGVDLFSLQIMLGHESLDMVRKYSHISSQYQVAQVYFQPMAKLLA